MAISRIFLRPQKMYWGVLVQGGAMYSKLSLPLFDETQRTLARIGATGRHHHVFTRGAGAVASIYSGRLTGM